MKPVLYDYWRSSASYRVRIALGLKGIDYDRVPVDLVAKAQVAPDYLAKNPQGLVPALEIDGLLLTQSLAIIEYLDERFPAMPLLPEDAAGRARVRAIALAIACEIHPLNNLAVLNRVEALAGPDARKDWNEQNLIRGLGAVEDLLNHSATGRFCHGEAPGLADCVLIPQLYNARRWGIDPSRWPRISAVSAACVTLDAIEAAHPDHFKPE